MVLVVVNPGTNCLPQSLWWLILITNCLPQFLWWFNPDLQLFTALVGSVNLGEWGLKMRLTKVSSHNQLYSEHHTISALRVKKGKVYNHKDTLHKGNTCLSTEIHKQIAIASCNE